MRRSLDHDKLIADLHSIITNPQKRETETRSLPISGEKHPPSSGQNIADRDVSLYRVIAYLI